MKPKHTKGQTKFIFELKKDDIECACNGYEDCMGCEFMFYNGVCALDMIKESDNDLRNLLQFLLKEIDYDHLRLLSRQVGEESCTRASTKKDESFCKE